MEIKNDLSYTFYSHADKKLTHPAMCTSQRKCTWKEAQAYIAVVLTCSRGQLSAALYVGTGR